MGMYVYPRSYPEKTVTYSYKKNRNLSLSKHFKLAEFRCKDGDDIIVVCPFLINNCLEVLYDYLDAYAINITSGYRTISHSKRIGGAGARDNHHLGQAADIKVKKTATTYYSAKEVACALQEIGWKHGIGLMNSSVHVDAGTQYWFDETRKNRTVADWHQYTGIKKVGKKTPTPAPVQKPTPSAPSALKYAVGQEVVFTTCYKSSSAPISEAIPASKMSKNHGKITKIYPGTKNPYLLDNGMCFVNNGDIQGLYKAPTVVHKGKPYVLTCDTLAIRLGPGKSYKQVGTLKKGQVFYVIQWKLGWAKLEDGTWTAALRHCKEKK